MQVVDTVGMQRQKLSNILLFSLDCGCELLKCVAEILHVEVGRHEERPFEGGEHKIRALDPVRGRDIYIVQSLYGDAASSINDKLVMLLFFIGSLWDAGAQRVTVLVPYLCYMRKDRRTKFQDPLSARYLAQLFEAVGINRLAVLDVHNLSAFENAFRCPTLHLTAQTLFVEYFAPLLIGERPVVASPDVGGVKRTELFRQALEEKLGQPVTGAFMEKYRSAGIVSGSQVVGDVEGRAVLILDDLIAGGTTMRRAAEAFSTAGAKVVYGAASHGVFAAGASTSLLTPAINRLVTTNSVGIGLSALGDRYQMLDISGLLADAINELVDGHVARIN